MPCPSLVGDNANLFLSASPPPQCISACVLDTACWTHLKHASGQVPYVTSNSGPQGWVCPQSLRKRWHRPPCPIILVPPLSPPCPADSLSWGSPWVVHGHMTLLRQQSCCVCSLLVLRTGTGLFWFSVPIEITSCPPLFTFFKD